MSIAVLQMPANCTQFNHLEKCSWPEPADELKRDDFVEISASADVENDDDEEQQQPGQFDIWSAIQAQKDTNVSIVNTVTPYVHPLFRRSSSMLSQQSLEICTESLGSETGSADFSELLADDELVDGLCYDDISIGDDDAVLENFDGDGDQRRELNEKAGRELFTVNYHCSIGRRSPARSFPPPLPSISRRDGPCLHMRPHRRDGRLVVEAVAVPSQNYLHAQREGGRLLLSFIDAVYSDDHKQNASENNCDNFVDQKEEQELKNDGQILSEVEVEIDEEEEEEEEEEVEVVDRGTVVEVKVSTQPQQQNGAMKVHRSSLVINKFVGGMPSNTAVDTEKDEENENVDMKQRRTVTTMTTAAAAVVAATTVSKTVCSSGYSCSSAAAAAMPQLTGDSVQMDNKLLFTSKLRNRGELLHNMKRCSQLKRPLFIWEPYCIATST